MTPNADYGAPEIPEWTYGAHLAVWSYLAPDGLLWSWLCSCGTTASDLRDGQTAIYALAAHLREQHSALAFGVSPTDGSA